MRFPPFAGTIRLTLEGTGPVRRRSLAGTAPAELLLHAVGRQAGSAVRCCGVAPAQRRCGALFDPKEDRLKGPRQHGPWADQGVERPPPAVRPATSWREAAGEAAQAAEPEDGAAWTTDHTRSNWLWVSDLTRWERALDIRGGGGAPAMAWGRHFAFVHHLAPAGAGVDLCQVSPGEAGTANSAATRANPCALPYRDEAFDCVIWEGALTQWGTLTRRADLTALLGQVFGECRRVLRAGGCLYLGIAVAAWPGRPVGAGRFVAGLTRVLGRLGGAILRGELRQPVSQGAHRIDRLSLLRTIRRLLTQAGFSSVQSFYVDPSYHQPWGIIPARRGAVLVYERRQSARAGLRWWLAWLGLHPLLYGSHMFVAYTREPETQPAPRRL